MTAVQSDVVGWREWVVLPDLCSHLIRAKIDTGARTSALHAFDLRLLRPMNGPTVADFEIHPLQDSSEPSVRVQCPVVEFRDVKSSNGDVERRPAVSVVVQLGQRSWPIDVTLTDRDEMGYRMLLGRSALSGILVSPDASYLMGKPRARRKRKPDTSKEGVIAASTKPTKTGLSPKVAGLKIAR